MPRLLLGRKRRLPVVDQCQQTPTDNDHSVTVSLPPELWTSIAALLDFQELSRLYLLNRAFYDAFLSCKFRCISLCIPTPRSCNAKKELALLRAMQNPLIKKKIRMLYFESRWETNLISALDLQGWKSYFPHRSWSRLDLLISDRMRKGKPQAIQEAIHGALSQLSNIEHLSVYLRPRSSLLILDTLWTACSQTLTKLTLELAARLRTSDHTFPLGTTFPNLRSLHVPHCLPYPELLKELRDLIPEDGGCMEELSINLYGTQSPMLSTSFQSLKRLVLDGSHSAMASILPFLTNHRNTLQEIFLGRILSNDWRNLHVLNVNILTTLSVFIDPFLQYQDEMFPFLSCCTCLRMLDISHRRHEGWYTLPQRTPSFIKLLRSLPPSIIHLTFPGLIVDFPLFLSISQRLPNISSLTLSDCYSANKEIGALFFHPGSDSAQGLRCPWVFVFGGPLQARLKAFTQPELCESSQEDIAKLFLESITFSRPCCGLRLGDIQVRVMST